MQAIGTVTERAAMDRALDLARLGPAWGPNPRVGCVLIDDDGVLASGFHRGAGTEHAEVAALAAARAAGRDPRGATAVVTLEPCASHGRTGPCTEALIAAGVARVVFAVADPNPRAAGGAQRLRDAGVSVEGGVAEAEGRELLRRWLVAAGRGTPFVTLKTATTLDGRVAAADGSSRWVTGPVARAHAHELRAELDAIAVGTGTVLSDNPRLTARTADGSPAAHQPLRVVVGHRDVPADALVRGPELVHLRTHDVGEVLAALGEREVRHLLVEGGPVLASAFLRAGAVDEVHAYLAPGFLGAGRPVVEDLGIGSLAEMPRWSVREHVRLGDDLFLSLTQEG